MNKTLWNYYKQSADGQKAISLFNPEPEDLLESAENIANFLKQFDENENSQIILHYLIIYDVNLSERGFLHEEEFTRESFADFINCYDLKDFEITDDNNIEWDNSEQGIILPANQFRRKASTINALSLYLYYQYPYFKPILLPQRFNLIQKSCDSLGIEIPPIPHTSNYKEYLMFFYDLCGALNKYQQDNGLSDAELCACIYDYGIRVLQDESNKKVAELPQPTNIWLTGASGKDDFNFLDYLGKSPEANTSTWACNERTKRGDLVIIYCTSPRSYLHSIWRANSGGIFNPFDYYHCRTIVSSGVRLPEITFADLKNDSYFSQLPIVRKKLQGINGIELSAKDYSELIRLAKDKGADVTNYPQLFIGESINFGEIKLEKDVEENILIPILERLGYCKNDWTRQLQLKVGRKEKAIPDFVFFSKGTTHFENAPLVIEVKLDMSSMIEQQKAFRQALSYARLLRSKLMGICDKERLTIYNIDTSGNCNIEKPIFDNHWQTIYADKIIGAELNQLIGAQIIKEL